VLEDVMQALHIHGGRLLDDTNSARLKASLFENGHLNRYMIAKDIQVFLDVAKLDVEDRETARFVVIHGSGVGPDAPESGEKLSLTLTLFVVDDFNAATDQAAQVLSFQGAGHSVGLHTSDNARAVSLGHSLPTCRVIVNQAHCFATGGSFDNGLPFSLSMGCGSWGGNSIDNNLHYRHFMNITRVVHPIPSREPALDDVFGEYWKAAGR